MCGYVCLCECVFGMLLSPPPSFALSLPHIVPCILERERRAVTGNPDQQSCTCRSTGRPDRRPGALPEGTRLLALLEEALTLLTACIRTRGEGGGRHSSHHSASHAYLQRCLQRCMLTCCGDKMIFCLFFGQLELLCISTIGVEMHLGKGLFFIIPVHISESVGYTHSEIGIQKI